MSPYVKYQCIICDSQWGNTILDDENISHGLCKRCLRDRQKELVWKRQQREGFDQCYARGYEDCTEDNCAFFNSCLEEPITEWEKEVGKKKNGEETGPNQRV
jgi:hypothetical protein